MRPAPKLVVRVLRVMFAFELGLNRLDLSFFQNLAETGHAFVRQRRRHLVGRQLLRA